VIRRLEPGDVLLVTRLDRLARSTRDLLNMLATINERGASFRFTQGLLGRHHERPRPPDHNGSSPAWRSCELIGTRCGEGCQGARRPLRPSAEAHPAPAKEARAGLRLARPRPILPGPMRLPPPRSADWRRAVPVAAALVQRSLGTDAVLNMASSSNLSPSHRPPRPSLDRGPIQVRTRRAFIGSGLEAMSTPQIAEWTRLAV
jgi:hypothetical protein